MNYTRVSWGCMDSALRRRTRGVPRISVALRTGAYGGRLHCSINNNGSSFIIDTSTQSFYIYTRVRAEEFRISYEYSYGYIGKVDAMISTTNAWSPHYELH